ncbi:MAG: transglutaminase-like domain-containing protein [Verrucomicrobiales bacterium]|nr:transglutaminase-like domain-containing protein [Verrucomicrobiales bacterium]
MRIQPVILVAPFLAGFTGWMLSGSPIPMAFATVLLLVALTGKPFRKSESIQQFLFFLFPALSLVSVLIQIRLFQRGEALATNADLPGWFIAGAGITATAAMLSLLRVTRCGDAVYSLALAGGLLVFSSAFPVELYDFSEWQVYPLAALPVVLLLITGLSDRKMRTFPLLASGIAGSLALSGIGIFFANTTDRLDEWIHRDETKLTDYDRGGAPQLDDGRGGPDGSSRRLPREVKLTFDDRVRIYLQPQSPELFRDQTRRPLYLRTSTVAVFESDEVIAPVRSARWLYDDDDGETDFTISLRATQPYSEKNEPSLVSDYTLFIEREAAYALPLLHGTSRVSASALYEFADNWYQLAPDEKFDRLRYTASVPSKLPAGLPGGSINSLRQPGAPGIYLNLPPSPLAARVTHFCEALPDYMTLEGLRAYLEDHATYSLDFETPEDMSPVENLLFGNKEGHCELYAAAAVMMLRSLRIPSRLAYGYSGGIADRNQQVIAFRDRDFHAWAEVLTPENTWAVFDATPASDEAASRNPVASPVPTVDFAGYENFSTSELDPHERGNPLANWFFSATYFLSRHFLPLTGGGITLAIVFLLLKKRKKNEIDLHSRGQSTRSSRNQTSALMQALVSCGNLLGTEKEAGQTWREFLETLGKESEIPQVFEEIVSYHYRICYALDTPDPDTETNLQNRLTEWKDCQTDSVR